MVQIKEFVALMGELMRKQLPGKSSHLRMLPSARLGEFFPIPSHARKSSVLIPLFMKNDGIYTLLILRPEYDGVHSGQVSFPGGRFTEQDICLENTALREAMEETGIQPSDVDLLGGLTELYIPPSNFIVNPFVGYYRGNASFVPDHREVARIVEVDIRELMGNKNIKTKDIRIQNGMVFRTPYYNIEGLTVWGATAMIISEFSELVSRVYVETGQ